MNGSPQRLDLAVERARRAVAVGCLLSIDSDAHDIRELDYVRWGISQARRAWVEPGGRASTRARGRTCSPGSPAKPERRRDATAAYRSRADGRPRGPARPRARRGHRRRAVAAARAAGRLARGRPRCSGRCSSARSRSSADEAAPAEALVRRPDRVADPAGGRGGRLSRRDPARAVRAVARAGARRHLAASSAGRSRSRRGSSRLDGGLDRGRPDARCWSRSCSSRSSAFTGVAAMVPGGLVQPRRRRPLPRERPAGPGRGRRASSRACSATGRRRCGSTTVRDALWSALTYARGHRDRRRGAAGDGDPAADRAGAADPRLLPVGRVHGTRAVAPPRPALDLADALLAGLGVVVAAWNLLLRG